MPILHNMFTFRNEQKPESNYIESTAKDVNVRNNFTKFNGAKIYGFHFGNAKEIEEIFFEFQFLT